MLLSKGNAKGSAKETKGQVRKDGELSIHQRMEEEYGKEILSGDSSSRWPPQELICQPTCEKNRNSQDEKEPAQASWIIKPSQLLIEHKNDLYSKDRVPDHLYRADLKQDQNVEFGRIYTI